MKQYEKIGSWGGICLPITLILTKILISAPSFYASQSGSAGWLEVLISGVFEIFVLVLILKLASKFPNYDFIDIANQAFGKWGRIIIGAGSSIIFTFSSAAVFRSFSELIRNTIIRGISYESIAFFLIICGIAGAALGMRTQINLNGLILPCTIAFILFIILINTSRYSVSNILPIFGVGLKEITKNAFLKNASFFEIGIILFLIPYFKDKTSVKRISLTALTVSVFLTSSITLLYQLSVPYQAAATFSMPLYQMSRMIKAGTFFQRIEPLNIFLCGGAMLIYIGVGIRMAAYTFKKACNLPHTRPLVYVFAQIIATLALIPGSETSVEKIYDFILTYAYIVYPILPLIILIIANTVSGRKKRCIS